VKLLIDGDFYQIGFHCSTVNQPLRCSSALFAFWAPLARPPS